MVKPDDEIFCAALDFETHEQQDRWVKSTCADNPAQVQRLLKLLQFHRQMQTTQGHARSVLDRPEDVFQTFSNIDHLERGSEVGKYVIVEKIGEGGMGLVYQARQMTPVQRDVALKLLKPGMDSQRILARFAFEYQVLQQLEHPGITRIFDAGVQDNGRPFFAMELVPAPVAINEYVDRFGLDLRQRIRLMISVCEIIQHAHQRGIIHRDLKPSNILLEGKPHVLPEPKVIDFGIAKIVRSAEDDSQGFTMLGERFGTPAYMSPEQALDSGREVDIRSDVYSLGVILYELLTGVTPRGGASLSGQEPAWTHENYWEADIPLPSQQIGTGVAQAKLKAGELLPVPRWQRRDLQGEVDWIATKALAFQRNERYQTVADFQRDLERYLDGAPVDAAGPGLIYRLRKMVRRNRLATTTLVLFLLTIVLTSITTTSYAIRAFRSEFQAKKRVDEVLSIQQELTIQRDNAEQAKRQSHALLRIFQVRIVTSGALTLYFQQLIEAMHDPENHVPVDVAQSVAQVDVELLTKPHERLLVRGNWHWAAVDFPSELINTSVQLSSRQAVETLAPILGSSALQQPASTASAATSREGPAEAEFRLSFQEILLQQLRQILPEKDPFIAEVLDNCGLAAMEKGQWKEAEQFLLESVEIWGRSGQYAANAVQSQLFLADTMLQRGETEQAAAVLQVVSGELDQISAAEPGLPELRDFHRRLTETCTKHD